MDNLAEAFDSIRQKLRDLFDRVNQLEAAPTINPGGGGGAPVDAQYLVLAFNGTLTQERRLDFSARFATVDGGANADYDVDLAASGVGAGVYGSATQVPQITVDTYGRLTNASNIAISGVPPVSHPLLGNTYHNDVVTQGPTRGSLIYGNATPLWDELVLGGITGSVLTRNATDALWSTWGIVGTAAQTYTFPVNSGNVATGAGSLTAATANDATIVNHTHAIADTSDGDTAPTTILSSGANGELRIRRLGVGTAAIAVNGTIALPNVGYIGNGSATSRIVFDSSGAIGYVEILGAYVGINDATPSYHLDVNGIIGINGVQTVYNAGALGTFIGTMYLGNGGTSLSHTGGAEAQGNTAVGIDALLATTTGYYNSVVGYSALRSNTTGHDNVCIGMSAGYNNLSGINNVLIGNVALYYITASSYNVALGYMSGMLDSTGGFVNAASYSTFVGNDARPLGDSETNQIVIGSLARGYGSNTATIGTSAITDFYAFGNHIIENAHFIGNGSATARLVFDSSGATDYAYFSSCNVGIDNAAPNALLDVGNHGGVDPLNSSIIINRDRIVASNARGYVDGTLFSPTANGYAYACYDIRLRTGGASNIDHVIGVQGDIRHEVATTVTTMYTVGSMPQVNAGTVTTAYHYYAKEISGAGAVTTQYGLYMDELVKATTNWAIYATGSTKSRIGGQVGIGQDPSNYTLHTVRTTSVNAGDVGGIWGDFTSNATSGYGQTAYGAYISSLIADGANYGATAQYGIRSNTTNRGDQTLANAYGIRSIMYQRSAGTLTNAYGFYADVYSIEGTLTNGYGVYVDVNKTAGTLTNGYGLYVANVTAGATLNYAIYTNSGTVRIGGDFAHTGTNVGLYGVAVVPRATTAGASATFVANAGTAVNDASTFDGYTLKQVVKALRNIGILT